MSVENCGHEETRDGRCVWCGMGWEQQLLESEERSEVTEPRTVCPRCGGLDGHHGLVHVRHGNGGGHNVPCPRKVPTMWEAIQALGWWPCPVCFTPHGVADCRAEKNLCGCCDEIRAEAERIDAGKP